MPEYVLVDGPLAGHAVDSSSRHEPGETVVIEVVDVAQSPDEVPRYDYRVDRAPTDARPGRLTHIGR